MSTEELERRQGVKPITSGDDLAAAEDPFESDEEYEELLADLYASRHARYRVSLVVLATDVASALLRRRVPEQAVSQLTGHTLAELQAFAQLRGRPRPVNDSWIAACCLVRELPVATFNTKDFADFTEHEGLHLVPTK